MSELPVSSYEEKIKHINRELDSICLALEELEEQYGVRSAGTTFRLVAYIVQLGAFSLIGVVYPVVRYELSLLIAVPMFLSLLALSVALSFWSIRRQSVNDMNELDRVQYERYRSKQRTLARELATLTEKLDALPVTAHAGRLSLHTDTRPGELSLHEDSSTDRVP